MGKKRLILVISLLSFIMIIGGMSYAYFIERKEVVDVSIGTGEMSITYTNGNNLSLTGAVPLNDNLGKISPNYVDFSITGITDTEDIYYEIDLVPKSGNTLDQRYVKTYLTDQNEVSVHGVCPYDMMQNSKYNTTSKMIYSNIFLHNTNGSKKTTIKNFRLRIWLDEKYNNFGSKTFAFEIKVYAKNVNVNLMYSFPTDITNNKDNIKEIYFESDTRENIDRDYEAATIKADLTSNNYGSVKAWLEPDTQDNTKYIMYVKSDGETYLSTGYYLFRYWNFEKIEFNNVNTVLMSDMRQMFRSCTHILAIDFSKFNISNVSIINSLLYECTSLSTINISSFDTSNVTTMSSMFYRCQNISNIDLSNFNTCNVTDMSNMFIGISPTSFDISHLNTSNVTDMSHMFQGCALSTLDLSNFDTRKVSNMESMFQQCTNLVTLNLSSFDTKNVINMKNMFDRCKSITSLDISFFDTRNVTMMSSMFYSCTVLTTIYVSNLWNVSNVSPEDEIFNLSNALVGQNGTRYNSGIINKEYARIDDPPDNPGYFTYKEG